MEPGREPRSPREELAVLARATAADLARSMRRGVRRTARPAERADLAADLEPPAAEPRVQTAAAPGATDGPARTAEDVRAQAAACADLDGLRAAVARCTACELSRTRTQTVFSDGTGASGAMFVGEAPGADEDAQGVPFVGRAGRLLSDIVEKGMQLPREEVYIANVLKCRPPDNRDPTPAEKRTCTPWLDRQIELVGPRVLIPLGRHAAMHVLETEASMSRMRGRVHERGGRKVVPTFHPAYLLRSPGQKKECWQDIQLAMAELGLPARVRPAEAPAGSGADPADGNQRDAGG